MVAILVAPLLPPLDIRGAKQSLGPTEVKDPKGEHRSYADGKRMLSVEGEKRRIEKSKDPSQTIITAS